MKHLRASITACKSCTEDWNKHSAEERTSNGLCQWFSLDSGMVCNLLLSCPKHPARGEAAVLHYLDPNAPVRLGFIEDDYRD